jgi:hypothetical protein
LPSGGVLGPSSAGAWSSRPLCDSTRARTFEISSTEAGQDDRLPSPRMRGSHPRQSSPSPSPSELRAKGRHGSLGRMLRGLSPANRPLRYGAGSAATGLKTAVKPFPRSLYSARVGKLTQKVVLCSRANRQSRGRRPAAGCWREVSPTDSEYMTSVPRPVPRPLRPV